MGDFPHYFDIILFAMVAAFLVLRLRSVLGRRTGNERRRTGIVRQAEPAGEKKRGGMEAGRKFNFHFFNFIEVMMRRRVVEELRKCGP